MSLVKMTPKQRAYFKEEVGGPEVERDGPGYWTEAPELQGVWLGRGTEAFGIAGRAVDEQGFDRLFGEGADPVSGRALGRGWSPESDSAVAGFALTFSPPKSVSVLWAVADDHVADAVVAAQGAAARAALAYLEDHAAFTRRGRGGVYQVDTDGLTAAAFVHRTSRAADPQLHTHVLVANKVRAVGDGKWLAVDGTELYRSQKAAGLVYKAALRAELTRRLGVGWTAVDGNGIAEIVGVPEGLADAWSTRRHQVTALAGRLVAEREADLGRSLSVNERARVYQLAAYRSRAPKVTGAESTGVLRARWRAEAAEWGYAPSRWLGDIVGGPAYRPPPDAMGRWIEEAVGRLKESHATWGRAEAVEVLTTLLPPAALRSADEARRAVEVGADRLLGSGEVVCLAGALPAEAPESLVRADGMAAVERHGGVRFTTRAALTREATVLEAAANGLNARAVVVPDAVTGPVLVDAGLGPDQAEAVRSLVGGGERLVCLVGPARAGKSRSLAAARAAWEIAGHTVVGLAPSAMAAAVLTEEAGMPADTLAKFLHTAHTRNAEPLDGRSVVVVDEASMASTRDLAALTHHVVKAGAKLVLVGDDHQLGAVGAGGLFATLVAERGAAELSTVRRFAHAWERAATLRLRAGDPTILGAYMRHGRITGGTRDQILDRAFAAWSHARQEGREVVMTAADHDTVDALALRARAALVAAGRISPDTVPAGRQVVGVGDEVVTLRNHRQLTTTRGDWVRNGDRWRLDDLHRDGSAVLSGLTRSLR